MGAKKIKSLESLFPEFLFVRKDEEGDDTYFSAFDTDEYAVEDSSEPTVVATYKLESVYRAKKSVEYLN